MRVSRERLIVRSSAKRLMAKALVGLALSSPAVPANSAAPAASPRPAPDVEAQRQALHARVERVRAALRVEVGAVIEPEARSRFAQWYNWGDWPNGWNNYWNNWPNGWWNG